MKGKSLAFLCLLLIYLFHSMWALPVDASCRVTAFNAYLGDVKLDAHPVQAVNTTFTLRAIIAFWGGCCGGCGSCGGFHARKIGVTLQIPNELALLTGNKSCELSDVEGLQAGKSMTQEVLWTLIGFVEGKYAITVMVVSENTIPTNKHVSCELSIVRSLVVNQPLIEPKSPTPDEDVTVFVNISNPFNIGLRNVTLNYYIRSRSSETREIMRREVSNDAWWATIPRQPESIVTFYIEAYDINGNSTKGLEYTYRVQDPIRIEMLYKNTIYSVTLSSLVGVFLVAFASYSKHRKKRTSMSLREPTVLQEYEAVPHHKTLPYDDISARSKNRKRRLGLFVGLTLGVLLLFLAVYLGQLYEWIKFLGG